MCCMVEPYKAGPDHAVQKCTDATGQCSVVWSNKIGDGQTAFNREAELGPAENNVVWSNNFKNGAG